MANPSPTLSSSEPGPLALVMGGGGARAAYQVGLLRAVAGRFPHLEVPIITGVSAGAINAAHLAAHPGTFQEAVDDLAALWSRLSVDRVFRVDARTLTRDALRWGLRLVSGGWVVAPRIQSLMDTAPLRSFLEEGLGVREGPIPGIHERIRDGSLRALAISTSSYSTGSSVTWVQGGGGVKEWERPLRQARKTDITLDHVMASAALPLFFPAELIDGEWFGDGGIRLTAPLSPALHLGAHRILAISTRFDRTSEEVGHAMIHDYPPPAQVIGQLLNAVFLDLMDQDAARVEHVNSLLERLPPARRKGMRIVDLMTLRPSLDLGRLAGDFELRLPRTFRFMVRGLGTRETESPDVLSFLLFDPAYLERLMEMGERDAEARMGEMEAILDPLGAKPPPAPAEGESEGRPRGRRRRRRKPAAYPPEPPATRGVSEPHEAAERAPPGGLPPREPEGP
jgi:NTE family protein